MRARQAEYIILDVTLSLARRCERFEHKMGPDGMFRVEHWLLIRVAEVVRQAERRRDVREGENI